jgi:hypothetical protein
MVVCSPQFANRGTISVRERRRPAWHDLISGIWAARQAAVPLTLRRPLAEAHLLVEVVGLCNPRKPPPSACFGGRATGTQRRLHRLVRPNGEAPEGQTEPFADKTVGPLGPSLLKCSSAANPCS